MFLSTGLPIVTKGETGEIPYKDTHFVSYEVVRALCATPLFIFDGVLHLVHLWIISRLDHSGYSLLWTTLEYSDKDLTVKI